MNEDIGLTEHILRVPRETLSQKFNHRNEDKPKDRKQATRFRSEKIACAALTENLLEAARVFDEGQRERVVLEQLEVFESDLGSRNSVSQDSDNEAQESEFSLDISVGTEHTDSQPPNPSMVC